MFLFSISRVILFLKRLSVSHESVLNMSVTACERKGEGFSRVRICPFFAHVSVETSSADVYQKPKTLLSVLVSLVLRLDESNKIDK